MTKHSYPPLTRNEIEYRWRTNNPEKVKEIKRKTRLKNQYGLSIEDYDTCLEDQDGGCAICGKKEASGKTSRSGSLPLL